MEMTTSLLNRILFTISLVALVCMSGCQNNRPFSIDRSAVCNYIQLKCATIAKRNSCTIELKKISGDPFSEFIQQHTQRFDYVGWKILRSNAPKKRDPASSEQYFCSLVTDEKIHGWLLQLKPRQNKSPVPALHFSKAEMMETASRFFWCDEINPEDTSFTTKVCVGSNGNIALTTGRDRTVLEAFCFEAIFRSMDKDKKMMQEFYDSVRSANKSGKAQFTSFENHLQFVRQEAFIAMQRSKALEEVLLKYYREHRDGVSFIID